MKYNGQMHHDALYITKKTAAKIDNVILKEQVQKIIKFDYDPAQIVALKCTPLFCVINSTLADANTIFNEMIEKEEASNEYVDEMKDKLKEYLTASYHTFLDIIK